MYPPESGHLYTQPIQPPAEPTGFITTSPAHPPARIWPLVLAAVVLALVVGWLSFRPAGTTGAVVVTSGQAVQKCQAVIATRLKAPGSARYGDIAYTATSDTGVRVTGWVDAQNGFGALVRNRFVCAADRASGSWFVQDVTFSDW
jgi:hypothetical protein